MYLLERDKKNLPSALPASNVVPIYPPPRGARAIFIYGHIQHIRKTEGNGQVDKVFHKNQVIV